MASAKFEARVVYAAALLAAQKREAERLGGAYACIDRKIARLMQEGLSRAQAEAHIDKPNALGESWRDMYLRSGGKPEHALRRIATLAHAAFERGDGEVLLDDKEVAELGLVVGS